MKTLILLPGLKRFDSLALLSLRVATGLFLIYQSHDNVLSAARMAEFVAFLTQFGFPLPALLAPLAVWLQFLAGLGFILGFATRPLGLVTAIQFIIATWMVHIGDPPNTWWPAVALVVIGFVLATVGPGRLAIDALLEPRKATR